MLSLMTFERCGSELDAFHQPAVLVRRHPVQLDASPPTRDCFGQFSSGAHPEGGRLQLGSSILNLVENRSLSYAKLQRVQDRRGETLRAKFLSDELGSTNRTTERRPVANEAAYCVSNTGLL